LVERGGDRSRVLEVTRDMAEAYSPGVAAEMSQAAQTVDRIHVMQLFPGATDKVRCRERCESEEKRAMLAGTKCVRLKRESSLTERRLAKRRGPGPTRSHLRTARACQMAEAMRDACELPDRESAAGALDRLCSWTAHSNVPEMRVVARTLRKEREGVLNWWRRGSTNAILEGLNSVIQSIKRAARGFRNTGHFETMIFLRLGRLDFSAQLAVSSAID
jgi:transposase